MERPLVHIVDDDHHLRAMSSYLLQAAGLRTEIYADGAEFLEQAKLETGCILLDVRMPGMSGLQVQEELRRRDVHLPIIMLTAHGDVETAVTAMKLGAADFLEKPYTDDGLLAAVGNALRILNSGREKDETRRLAKEKVGALSPRELQLLRGLLAGMTNKAIAQRLDLSVRTVEMHRAHMTERLHLASLSEAIQLAMEAGLAPLNDCPRAA
jgi:two-component system response regulator FixJ